MTTTPEIEYSNPTRLTLGLVASLAAFVVLAEVGIWSSFLEVDFLQEALTTGLLLEGPAAASEQRQGLVGGFQLLVFALTAGLFVRWVYVMNRNAHALEARGMRYGPMTAAGWLVVPILQLWKPFDVLAELFRASHPDHIEDWRRAPVPHLLTLWWTLWLLFLATTALALVADVWATSVAQLHTAAWGGAVAGVVAAPLGVAAAVCVWRVHALQRRRFRYTAPLRVRHPWPTRSTEEANPA